MKTVNKKFLRSLAAFLATAIFVGALPIISMADNSDLNYTTISDSSTASTYTDMLGTDADGARYAGRVWADKSVYTDDTVTLDNNTETNNDDFMVVYSALGSSTSKTTISGTGDKLDVVFVMDVSSSMANTVNGSSRLAVVTKAANSLIDDILKSDSNRLAIVTYSTSSDSLLPLNHYDYATGSSEVLSVSTSSSTNGGRVQEGSATITATVSTGSTSVKGYYRGTNLQAGINEGMSILAERDASDVKDRTPVIIVLTAGVADTAVSTDWHDIDYDDENAKANNYGDAQAVHPYDNTITACVALSTLLNASYMKASIEDTYGATPQVFGISVDLSSDSDAYVVMNPAEAFNSDSSDVGEKAYTQYTNWLESDNAVAYRESNVNWSFNQLPADSLITKKDVVNNINYIDKHYSVSSTELEAVFKEIYTKISTPAFNPITDSRGDIEGSTPLTYVDFIGEYMEVKEFKAVTLFGTRYTVTQGEKRGYVDALNGATRTIVTTYIVGKGSEEVTHPVLNTVFNISESIIIELVEEQEGIYVNGKFVATSPVRQTVRVKIYEDALPFIVDYVDIDGEGNITFTEKTADPIRVYYTVGVIDEITDGEGNVDLTKVDDGYITENTVDGKVQFYSNRWGEMNTAENGVLYKGDAHVSFAPSDDNRYYYHQSNFPIYSSILDENGNVIDKNNSQYYDPNEWGILYWVDGATKDFTLNQLTAAQAEASPEDVFTVVAFFTQADNTATTDVVEGSEVGYLAYSSWEELRNSVVFGYVSTPAAESETGMDEATFLNYDSENDAIVKGPVGYAIDASDYKAYLTALDAYVKNSDSLTSDNVYAYLAVGSQRVTRLNNMTKSKTENTTGTALNIMTPEYNDDATHVGGIVGWVGNNGLLSVTSDTGIMISKTVTETVEGADEYFEFTITSSAGETAEYKATYFDATGQASNGVVAFTGGSATVNLRDGDKVYIKGLVVDAVYTVTETANNWYNVASVNNNTVADSASLTIVEAQYQNVEFVNSPKTYGNVTINKVVHHPFGSGYTVPDMEFEITVDLDGNNVANRTDLNVVHSVDGKISVETDSEGKFRIYLANGESVTVYGLEEGTVVKGSEASYAGFSASFWDESGTVNDGIVTVVGNSTVTAGVLNTYNPDKVEDINIEISGTKTFNVEDNSGWTDETFKVYLRYYNKDMTPATWEVIGEAIVSSSDRTFIFSGADTSINWPEFDEYGTYAFEVVEEFHGTTVNGITYDSTMHTFSVVVGDSDIDGKLEIVKVYSTHGDSISVWNQESGIWVNDHVNFTNKYSTTETSVDIRIMNKLVNESGSDIVSKEGFMFELYPCDEDGEIIAGTTPLVSDITDAVGETHISLEFHADTDIGTHYYILQEKIPENEDKISGMTYSSESYFVVAEVTENGEVTVVDLNVYEDETMAEKVTENVFTNTYDPKDAEVTLKATKELVGRNIVPGEFDFVVVESDDSSSSVGENAVEVARGTNGGVSGKEIVFDTFTLSEVGTFMYDVYEEKGDAKGVKYDESIFRVDVTVVDNNGKLEATYEVFDSTDDAIVFNNTYVPAETSFGITAEKILENKTLKADMFYFELTEVSGVNGSNVENGIHLTAQNAADGTIAFDDITYTTAGTYYYLINEVNGGQVINGIKYTADKIYVTVEVTDDSNGQLDAKIISIVNNGVAAEKAVFTNTYTAAPVRVSIEGTKEVYGRAMTATDIFTFGLYNMDGSPVLDNEGKAVKVSNDAAGNFSFDLMLDKVDKYEYQIKEDSVGVRTNGITNDDAVYTVVVDVTDGGIGQLEANVTITLYGVEGDFEKVQFVNEYTADPVDVQIKGTNSIDGRNMTENDIFTFSLYNMDGTPVLDNAGQKVTASNDADGNFSFDLTFDAVDEYQYIIREDNAGETIGEIKYDDTRYIIVIEVVDNGLGKLEATVFDSTKESVVDEEDIVFTNKFVPEVTSTPEPGDNHINVTNPETGIDSDFTNIEFWSVLMVLCACAVISIFILEKSKKTEG